MKPTCFYYAKHLLSIQVPEMENFNLGAFLTNNHRQ